MRSMLRYEPCEGVAAPSANFDVMMNGSAETNIQLTARFLPPIVANQGMAGDRVPIVATLGDRNGAIPGAEGNWRQRLHFRIRREALRSG